MSFYEPTDNSAILVSQNDATSSEGEFVEANDSEEDNASTTRSDTASTITASETPSPETLNEPSNASDVMDVTTENDDDEYQPDGDVSSSRRSMINTRSRTATGDNIRLTSHFALFTEPGSVSQAMKSAEAKLWQEAMNTEMNSLIENETWTLLNIPERRKAIQCK